MEKEKEQKKLLNEKKYETFSNVTKKNFKVEIEGNIDTQYAKSQIQEIANKISLIDQLSIFTDVEVNIKIKGKTNESNINEMDKLEKMNKILKKRKVDPDLVSPNYVANVAYSNNIKLTSDEVVYISNNFE